MRTQEGTKINLNLTVQALNIYVFIIYLFILEGDVQEEEKTERSSSCWFIAPKVS